MRSYLGPFVEFTYLGGVHVGPIRVLSWSSCALADFIKSYLDLLVEFMYLLSTRMPGERNRRQFKSLLLPPLSVDYC